jgi:phosphoglycerate kinase
MTLRSIADFLVVGKIVLVRADLNVPMRQGRITDATRIVRFAPTVLDLLQRGATVVVMSHLGRPDGVADPVLTLRPVAEALAAELGREVSFVADCVGPVAERRTRSLPSASVALLENLRCHAGEEAGDRSFAMMLSVHGDIYVDDAFSCAHRAHASISTIAGLMPAYAGSSLLAEVAALTSALDNPSRPAVAIIGGAKVSTKIGILQNVVGKVDRLVIGGGMANTFLAAQGNAVGRSLHEPQAIDTALRVLKAAKRLGCEIVLPLDVVVAREFSAHAPHEIVPVGAIANDAMALDIGPQSAAQAIAVLEASRTVLWNGPLGAFELEPFGLGTFAVARAAAALTVAGRLRSIAGGGDTAAALTAAGTAENFSYLSTAGGAFLEWIEGRSLPGIEALNSHNIVLEES